MVDENTDPDSEDLVTFDGDTYGYPTSHDLVIRDEEALLVYAGRRRNADVEWEVRSYRVLGDDVSFDVETYEKANLATIFVEEFDPDELTVDEKHSSQRPVYHGVPVAVAVSGKPAIAAWLVIQGESRESIAATMDVSERTVDKYCSRFRRDGEGIPDDVPRPGDLVPEVPPEYDPAMSGPHLVADGGNDGS